jgi:carbon monoxide dehydrogenase subunit G
MKINNEFTVSAPIQQAWDTMLNLERIAPCLPGAAIQDEKDEGEYDGTMKVKIGPITANYKGTVKFEEVDEDNHRAVLQATGRDARGQGTASATIVSTLQEEDDGTKVSVETDMKLTGRAAQFGRGIAQDVATKMLDQFASCLEEEITGGPEEGAAAAASTAPQPTGEENGSRDGSQQAEESPAVAAEGTAGRVIDSEDPTVMAGGMVEGAVVTGAASAEDSAGATTTETGQPEPQQAPRREREEPEAFDIGAASQEAILKRARPLLIGAGVLLVLIWLLRRRRR